MRSRFRLLFLLALCTGCGTAPPPATEPPPQTVRFDFSNRTERPATSLPNHPSMKSREQWTMKETVVDSLARIGSAAIPHLRRELDSNDPLMRRQAADILAKIGPDAVAASSQLIILLDDDDAEVRKAAARALGQIGAEAANAIPSLVRVLQEETLKEHTTRKQDDERPNAAP